VPLERIGTFGGDIEMNAAVPSNLFVGVGEAYSRKITHIPYDVAAELPEVR